jgi:hypothetical protein
MKITCECGKLLYANECGFHNDNYKDVLLFLCPYCGVKTTAFVSLGPEGTPGPREIVPGLEYTPERSQGSLQEVAKQFFNKMIQRNNVASGVCLGPG